MFCLELLVYLVVACYLIMFLISGSTLAWLVWTLLVVLIGGWIASFILDRMKAPEYTLKIVAWIIRIAIIIVILMMLRTAYEWYIRCDQRPFNAPPGCFPSF